MRFYHRTTREAADSILKEGFRDTTGSYLTTQLWTGVWVSNVPLDMNEGAKGDALLEIRIPLRLVKQYEWVEEGKGYREFLVPAAVLNANGKVRPVPAEEEMATLSSRWRNR